MTHKHLHELLQEDQEPFQLRDFIADRRTQLKTTTTTFAGAGKTSHHLKKQNPIIKSTIKHVCFLSFQDSPDYKKSPFFDFPAKDIKSPCGNNATVFLNIPARTAAMLLDAATRVQKPKPGSGSKPQTGFGLLGSILRRLKDRSLRTKCRELGPVTGIPITPVVKRSRKKTANSVGDEIRFSYWSEKSTEMETSCSSRSIHEFEENDQCFCSSNPSSPFRFSLQKSPVNIRRKSDSSSPVASPSRHCQQDKQSYEGEHPQEIDRQADEEKEHCSPVSVLDTLFDDDEERDSGTVEEDSYDIECSYASVERAKHKLLLKLQRFERLAGLDPINLEKHMLEQKYEEDEDEDDVVNEEVVSNEEFAREIVSHLGVGKIPWYMKKLVYDLVDEENKNKEPQVVVQMVCKRLHSWKVVELNTIDMMVETDFRSEGWKGCDEEIKQTGIDITTAIFGFLVDELAEELVNSSWQQDFQIIM
uniref:uncharacterized protein LOC122581873 n=1 Tax=Erigeron canadensis TaxID=72917 RepID=UPI001CB92B7A|nr:uncharacterized protein LOC122581873 [Erigeron canadensis]